MPTPAFVNARSSGPIVDIAAGAGVMCVGMELNKLVLLALLLNADNTREMGAVTVDWVDLEAVPVAVLGSVTGTATFDCGTTLGVLTTLVPPVAGTFAIGVFTGGVLTLVVVVGGLIVYMLGSLVILVAIIHLL
jgi:hypothetical protein